MTQPIFIQHRVQLQLWQRASWWQIGAARKEQHANPACAIRWLAEQEEEPKSDRSGDFGLPPSSYLLAPQWRDGREADGKERGDTSTGKRAMRRKRGEGKRKGLIYKNNDSFYSSFNKPSSTLDSRS